MPSCCAAWISPRLPVSPGPWTGHPKPWTPKMGACCENTPVQPESRPMTNPPHAESADHGYIRDKDRYLARLKRIEGQARGIHRMINEETYCIDILTQISSITSALNNVALSLLDDHVRHC